MSNEVSIRTGTVVNSVVLGRAITTIIVCASLAVTGGLLFLADRGFDFTDEAFYLLNAEAPDSFALSQTQFGYALHPLLALAHGDVAAMRRILVLLLAALGATAGYVWGWRKGVAIECRVAFVSVCMCAPLAYYYYFILTPSYNSLILVAGLLLVIATGMLYTLQSLAGTAAVIAAAALVSLMAKLTSAAAFGAITVLVLFLLTPRHRSVTRSLLLIGASTLVVLAIVAMLLPVNRIAQQLTAYLQFFGPNSPSGRGPFDDLAGFLRSSRGMLYAAGIVGMLAVTKAVRFASVPWVGRTMAVGIGLFAMIALVVSAKAYAPANLGLDIGNLAAATSMLATLIRRDPRLGFSFLCMMAIPWAAGLGTTNYLPAFTSTFNGGLFAIIAAIGILLAAPLSAYLAYAGLGLVLFYPVSSLKNGIANPYRLPVSITEQTEPVTINSNGARLLLDATTAKFVHTLREIALREGFCEREPMIDMSGRIPGIAYVMGALPPGFGWLPAGYPFSDRFATFVLERVSREVLDRSWVVVPATDIAFPETARRFGLEPPLPFHRLVAKSLQSPQGVVFDLYAPFARAPCAH